MDRFKAMLAVEEIAKRGSLTAAGAILGVSLPSLVRQLAALERELGAELFHRTTRRVTITDEGRAFLRLSQRVRADFDAFEGEVRGERAEPAGLVTVTAPFLLGQMHVAPAIVRLLRKYPKLNVRLLLQDRVVDMVEARADVAVRVGRLKNRALHFVRVGQTRQMVVCGRTFEETWRKPKTPQDLLKAPCINVDGNNLVGPWTFRQDGKTRSVAVSGPFAVNIGRPAIEACVEGLAIGRFLGYQIRDELASRALLPLLEKFEIEPLPVSLVTMGAKTAPARIRVVISELRQALKREFSSE